MSDAEDRYQAALQTFAALGSNDDCVIGDPVSTNLPVPVSDAWEWEELSDDAGDLVAWDAGVTREGSYIGLRSIALTEEQRAASADPNKEDADMLVFEQADGERWCTWTNFQLNKLVETGKFVEGEYYRLVCKTQRKTKKGAMYVFSIQHRTNASKVVNNANNEAPTEQPF